MASVEISSTHFNDEQTGLPQTIGRYQILELLGQGGMGRVYRGHDPKLKRTVALKVLLSMDAKDQMRFTREAQAMAKLRHPNIIPVYEIGKHDKQPYFVMEFLEGQSLGRFVREAQPSLKRIAQLMAKVARAIEYAHEHEIIHRDIKPDNILLNSHQEPVIMDFGLAKSYRDAAQLSQSGMILGTPAYMSPEQAAGNISAIGPLSDVYSLGATLYECLTLVPPFRAQTYVHIIYMVIREDPVAPRRINRSIPQDLENICLKAMSKEKARRYQKAQELAEDLERFIAGESTMANAPHWGYILKKKLQRNWLLFGTALSLALLLVVSTVVFFCFLHSQKRKAEQLAAIEKKARQASEKAEKALRKEKAALEKEKQHSKRLAELAFDLLCKVLGKHKEWVSDPETSKALTKTIVELERCGEFKRLFPHNRSQFLLRYLVYGQSHDKHERSQSIEDYTQLIRLLPHDAQSYLNRGELYEHAGQWEQALSDYNQAIRLDPAFQSAYLKRGAIYQRNQQYSAAAADASQVIKLNPSCVQAYQLRGQVYHYTNKPQEALADYNKAIGLKPNSHLYFYRGQLYYRKLGRLKQALNDYACAISLNKKLVQAYFERGNIYLCQYRFSQALADYRRVLRLHPQHPFALTDQGIIYLYSRKYDQGLQAFNQAIAILKATRPQSRYHAFAYYYRGQLYLARKQYQQAAQDYQQALALHLPQAHYGLGICLWTAGKYEQARRAFGQLKAPQLNCFPQRECFALDTVAGHKQAARKDLQAFLQQSGVHPWQKWQARFLLGQAKRQQIAAWLARTSCSNEQERREWRCQWLYVQGLRAWLEQHPAQARTLFQQARACHLEYLFEHILSNLAPTLLK